MPGCQPPGDLAELAGSVKAYARHVLVAAGHEELPGRIESSPTLLGTMASEVKALGAEMDPAPKLTALRDVPAGPGYDVLVFPEAVRYRNVDAAAWQLLFDGHVRAGMVVPELHPEPLEGLHIFTCTHVARDERCGACGPLVIAAFEAAIARRGLADVHVHATTHVGGHRFAGNVLVYPGGTWYGYVRPPDVEAILDAHLDGDVWEPHRRGAMVTDA